MSSPEPLSKGLRFINEDGTWNHCAMRQETRRRAKFWLKHNQYNGDFRLAMRCERQGVLADVSGEEAIWEVRAHRAGIRPMALTTVDGKELADSFEQWGIERERERNSHVAEPFRGILNSISAGI